MINRYKKYLEIVDAGFKNILKEQAPFIKCKKGCSYCCKEGEYPLSELEYVYLMFYYTTLSDDIRAIINQNIDNLLKQNRQKFYSCPFLINDECSVYAARPLICRTFGLISIGKQKSKIPFCVDLGLNYTSVYDKERNAFIWDENDAVVPKAYNIDRTVLRNNEKAELFDINFGEDKALVEWLREDYADKAL